MVTLSYSKHASPTPTTKTTTHNLFQSRQHKKPIKIKTFQKKIKKERLPDVELYQPLDPRAML
jgi:hypothetical protein